MRLIDADKVFDKMQNTLDMQELYLPVNMQEQVIDEMPTIEAIPKEKVDQAIARIKGIINSGQFNEGVCFGLTHAMFIFKMMTMEEDGE